MRSTLQTLLLFSATTFAIPSPRTYSTSDPLPLVLWHGLGDNYDNEGIKNVADLAEEVNPGTYTYTIRFGSSPSDDRSASFFGNLTTQIDEVCAQIADDPILSTAPAINALGFSQGGQFIRGYVQRCNKPPVRSLVTMGSQHNGIAEFGKCKSGDWICQSAFALLRWNTWSGFVQNRLVPAQYYRTVNETTGEPTAEYLENSNFLADINNERPLKNPSYKKNLASLEHFAMYMFGNDTVAIPKESAFFAEVKNLTDGKVTPLQERAIYKEDWIGLKELDERGALHFRTIEDEHMHMSDDDLRKLMKDFFSPSSSKKVVLDKVQQFIGHQDLL